MGLILDTSVLIHAEKESISLGDLARQVRGHTQERIIGIAAISLAELANGAVQSKRPVNARVRRQFLEDVRQSADVHAMDAEIAIEAGLLAGRLRERGLSVGLADVMIAATALQAGFGVLTYNVKHFAYVDNLRVVRANL